MTNKEFGSLGEELACNYLMRNGFRLLHKNWRQGRYEVDIVALKDSQLHFVEVKTRSSSYIEPQRAVNREKMRHIGRAAMQYKRFYHLYYPFVIDVVAIVYYNPNDYKIKFIPEVNIP